MRINIHIYIDSTRDLLPPHGIGKPIGSLPPKQSPRQTWLRNQKTSARTVGEYGDKGRNKDFPCFFSPVWQQYFWATETKGYNNKNIMSQCFLSAVFRGGAPCLPPPKWWIVAIPLNRRAPAKPKEEKSCADGLEYAFCRTQICQVGRIQCGQSTSHILYGYPPWN